MHKPKLNQYLETFVSKWLILGLDMAIVVLSYLSACLLKSNFEPQNIFNEFNEYAFLFLLGTRLICFLYFSSYTGIVRHTSIEDATALFKALLTSSFIVAGISHIAQKYYNNVAVYIPVSLLIIDFAICLFLLVSIRIFVKYLYESLLKTNKTANIILYGAGKSGLTTKNLLMNDKYNHYSILCFIDDNPSKINKTIEGIPVLSIDDALVKFFHSNHNNIEVILTIQQITPSKKNDITELFLRRGITLKTVPPLQRWVKGEFAISQIHEINIEDLLERPAIQLTSQKIEKELTGKTILVTGAAGSIGSEIVRQLLKFAPHKIILLDQAESSLYDLEFEIYTDYKDYLHQTQISLVIANICDATRIKSVFKKFKPQYVFHAAAYKHVPLMENNPYEAVKVNVLGTKNMVDCSLEFNIDKFVLVSTDKAVNPTNVMGATKRLAEMYSQSTNNLGHTRFVITRFGNVLGSNGSVIPLFKKQIEAGGPITVTHPEITRFFMTIPEASQLVLEAGSMGEGGEIFAFDMGDPVRIVDLAKKMIQLYGFDKDIKISFTGLRPGEKLYEEVLKDDENTLSTHHPKIMRAKVNPPGTSEMNDFMDTLNYLLKDGSNTQLVAHIKSFVPEYISNNSVYEQLDSIIKIKNP